MNHDASSSTSTIQNAFHTRDDVEQFLIDAALAQTVKRAVELLQQFLYVLIGAFHRRETARVLGE